MDSTCHVAHFREEENAYGVFAPSIVWATWVESAAPVWDSDG